MMDMRVEGQREPHVKVGEKHLRHPESLRCVYLSSARCRAHWFEPEEPEFASFEQGAVTQPPLDNEPSRRPPLENDYPLCTWPRISMRSLFIAGEVESSPTGFTSSSPEAVNIE